MQKLTVPVILTISSACALLVISFGFRSSFGLFLNDILGHYPGREMVSFAMALQNITWGVVAVFAGGIADKYGSTKVIVGAAALYGIGIWLTSAAQDLLVLNFGMGILIGAGIAGTSFGIILPAMARAVGEERRQWALGLGTAAGSFGQFLVVPTIQGIIDVSSWQMALYVMAGGTVLMAALAIPLAPYSGARHKAVDQHLAQQTIPEALREALSHGSYLWLVAGFYVCGFNLAFVTAHMPSFLQDLGFSAKVGAWSLSLIGLCNVIGAYVSGHISSRWEMRKLLSLIYLGRAISVAIFMLTPPSITSVVIFSITTGFLWLATIPPTSGLVALMFGERYMSMLYGIVFLSHQLGSFCGVWLGGWLYDHYGSYNIVWWMSVGLAIFASLAHWPIKEQPVARLQAEKF